MTKTANKLGEMDGIDVLATSIAIRNAGDGLSKAMKIEPRVIHHDDTVYVVLECICSKVEFDKLEAEGGGILGLIRKQVLKAGVATIVDEELVSAVIGAQRLRNEEADEAERIAKEQAKGVHTLPGVQDAVKKDRKRRGGADPIDIKSAADEVIDALGKPAGPS